MLHSNFFWHQHEIDTLNTPEFKKNANWLQMLTQLIEDHQGAESTEGKEALKEWNIERDELRYACYKLKKFIRTLTFLVITKFTHFLFYFRNATKCVFNKQFGSVFRTYHNPTYFSRRLFRFADIYTSNISNLLNYSVSHTFYPRRGVMPHEYISHFM